MLSIRNFCAASGTALLVRRCLLVTAFVTAVLVLLPAPGLAAQIAWNDRRVDLVASNEPLDSFLQRFFASLQIPVRTSPQVDGQVSGRFNQPAELVLEELAASYGLNWYFDGSAVFVTSIAENDTRLFTLSSSAAERFSTLAEALKITDPRYPISLVPEQGYLSASGPPRFLQRIDDVVQFLRQPVSGQTAVAREPTQARPPSVRSVPPGRPSMDAVRVFKLKHAWAADREVRINGVRTIITGVAALVANTMGPVDGQVVQRSVQQVLPVSGGGLLGSGMRTIGRADGYEVAQGLGEASSPPLDRPLLRVRNTPASPVGASVSGPLAIAVKGPNGTGLIQADTRLNAVIVRDSVERMPLYEQLIMSLDQAVPLIEIEATVVDIRSDRAEALGVDFSLIMSNRPGRTSSPNVTIDPGTVAVGVQPRASVVVGSEKNFLYARIDALRQAGDATVQAQPRVLTLDNSEAVLSDSQEFFVRVAGADVVDLFNVNVGLTLRVTPSIVEEGGKTRFKLQVRIDDGSIEQVSVVDGIPVVNRTAISANVIVDEGESLFIGGLNSERTASSERGVPGLSGIPVLGALFRSRASESRKFQRMFLLTPKLIKGVI